MRVGLADCLITILILAIVGCGSKKTELQNYAVDQSGHRLVRVSFRGGHGSYRIRINEGTVEKLSTASFTNNMVSLRLEYGDIVLWEALRDGNGKELSWPGDLESWWFGYLTNLQSSWYCINSDNMPDFFASPVCYWKASRGKPRPLTNAVFYVDGRCLGTGAVGFRAMVETFHATDKPRAPFILSPRIKNEGSASPGLALEQLDAWAEEVGIPSSGVSGVMVDDFARTLDPDY